MNRYLKFRAWNKNSNEMEYSYILGGPCMSNGKIFHIMQFTGYKDIHGKEIYEGDIVKRRDGSKFTDGREQTWIVVFKNAQWEFENTPNSPATSYPYFHSHASDVMEVTGNIYEGNDAQVSAQNVELAP